MTFNECRDLILLQVNGGEMNTDAAVQQADVEAYLPAAISKAVSDDLKERLLLSGRSRSAGITFAPLTNYFNTYEVLVEKDSKNLYSGPLPGKVFQMGMVEAIESVIQFGQTPKVFNRVSGQGAFFSMGSMAQSTPMFWLEDVYGQTFVRVNKVVKTCKLTIRALLDPSCDRGDEALPCADDLATKIIAMCCDHFRKQRGAPADVEIDNHDVNAPTDKK